MKLKIERNCNFTERLIRALTGTYGCVTIEIEDDDILKTIDGSTDRGYNKAVKSIMESNMWNDQKRHLIQTIKRNQSNDFYEAIISVLNSNMWTDQKVDVICSMCKEK